MSAKSKKMPTPDELLAEINGQPDAKTYEFEDYLPAIDAMQRKNHSYAEIAQFFEGPAGLHRDTRSGISCA